jgi:hypothetical protein
MSFDHEGHSVTLQSNNNPSQFTCTVVELLLVHESEESPTQLPDEVVQILKQFQVVF